MKSLHDNNIISPLGNADECSELAPTTNKHIYTSYLNIRHQNVDAPPAPPHEVYCPQFAFPLFTKLCTFKLLTFNIQIDFIIVDSSLEILGFAHGPVDFHMTCNMAAFCWRLLFYATNIPFFCPVKKTHIELTYYVSSFCITRLHICGAIGVLLRNTKLQTHTFST